MTKYQGKITRWQDDKGFGFIERTDNNLQDSAIFFHINEYRANQRPVLNEAVVFEIGQGRDGKPCAVNVQQQTFVRQKVAQQNARQVRQVQNDLKNQTLLTWVAIGVLFFVLLTAIVLVKHLPLWIIGWYFAMSLATYLLYAHDKKAAQNGDWRVQEASLHKLAFAGGWVGAAFAHWLLRHKSTKPEFRRAFYLTVMGNLLALVIISYINMKIR